jgi:hypothetical protein
MNTDRINHLADVIAAQPHTNHEAESGFWMNSFMHRCGTPACIAGWADHLSKIPVPVRERPVDGVEARARDWLGLDDTVSYRLFWGPLSLDLKTVTPTHAAAVLSHLAETGDVDW